MSMSQRFPFVPRMLVALMSGLLVVVVGATFAAAQNSEPVSTGPLTAPSVSNGVSAGDTVVVSGAGFSPGGSIDVTIESTPVLLKTVLADAAGSFTTTVTIPSGLAGGAHTLKATGPDPAGGLRVLSIAVTVSGAPDGGTLVRTGANLAPMLGVGLGAIIAGACILSLRHRRA